MAAVKNVGLKRNFELPSKTRVVYPFHANHLKFSQIDSISCSLNLQHSHQQVLEQVNAVMGNLFATDVMSKETVADTVR